MADSERRVFIGLPREPEVAHMRFVFTIKQDVRWLQIPVENSALMCVVNRKRAANGLAPLKVDRRIQRAASRHAHDMAKHHYFAHQRPGGPDLTTRLHRAGWHGRAWGENIAYGCGPLASPKATLRAWMNSPPHRAIILSGTYRHGGVGVVGWAPCGSGGMWVLDVGRK